MSSVLGVSVGAGAIHLARAQTADASGAFLQNFEQQAVDVAHKRSEDLVAEVVGVVRATSPYVSATAIAYRSEQQATAIRAAMAHQRLDNYQLVPESQAILAFLDSNGALDGASSVAVYDMGRSGLTVSVVDTATRQVRYSERTSEISGAYFDALIRDHQIASGRITAPPDKDSAAALDALCSNAKVQLSSSTAVALPADDGVVLLTRENFDNLITLAVESSARMARDVIMRSDQPVEAIVAVGGGSAIPLVQTVLQRWMGLPVIVPLRPATVAARGAALLATPILPVAVASPSSEWLAKAAAKQRRKREISGAGLAASSLAVVAAIGLALGYGGKVLDHGNDNGGGGPIATLPSQPGRPTTMDPTDGIEPVRSAAQVPPASSLLPPAAPPAPAPGTVPGTPAATTADGGNTSSSQAPANTRDPNVVMIPGLPTFTVPTLPPPPPAPQINLPKLPPPPAAPPLPTFRLPG